MRVEIFKLEPGGEKIRVVDTRTAAFEFTFHRTSWEIYAEDGEASPPGPGWYLARVTIPASCSEGKEAKVADAFYVPEAPVYKLSYGGYYDPESEGVGEPRLKIDKV